MNRTATSVRYAATLLFVAVGCRAGYAVPPSTPSCTVPPVLEWVQGRPFTLSWDAPRHEMDGHKIKGSITYNVYRLTDQGAVLVAQGLKDPRLKTTLSAVGLTCFTVTAVEKTREAVHESTYSRPIAIQIRPKTTPAGQATVSR